MEQANRKFKITQIGIKVVLAVLIVILLLSINKSFYEKRSDKKQTLSAAQQKNHELPVRLLIPAINVNAAIQHVGINPKGEMEVPSNTVDVGWFKFGARPGEKGNAAIAGHFDGTNGKAGVFTNLQKLKTGDKLYVQDSKGITTSFVVREKRIYNPGYVYDVFSSSISAHLNLITCDGLWDEAKKSYNKRLVVFADIIH